MTTASRSRGRKVHRSRGALQDSLLGKDAEDIAAVQDAAEAFMDGLTSGATEGPLVTRMAAEGRWLQRLIAGRLDPASQISVPEAARLLVLLSFDSLREVAWSDLRRSNADAYVALLTGLIRRAPVGLQGGVSGLLALAAWVAGDGALSWCAVDRCHAADPEDTLADHIAGLLESATPPAVWSPMPAESLPVFAMAKAELTAEVLGLRRG